MNTQPSPTKSQLMTAYNKVRYLPGVDAKRLNRAFGIAQSKRIAWAGDESDGNTSADTLNVKSSDGDVTYHVNSKCQCEDYYRHTHACKHRLCRRLLQVAGESHA